MPLDQGAPADDGLASQTIALPDASAPTPNGARRKRLFAILGLVVLVAAVLWLIYWLLVGSHHVETDNAYVQASTAQVTALVAGPIVQVPVDETQVVKKGQVLALIDPSDYRLAVERARAQLGQAERRVRQYEANEGSATATIAARNADVARAEAQLASARSDANRAAIELQRRQNMRASGAVSGDELTEAQNRNEASRASVVAAQAAVAAARANALVAGEQRKAASVLVAGTSLEDNPEVAAARAALAQAELDLSRTTIRAPAEGVVTKSVIEVGQRLAPGAVLMNVVPIQSAYVDANFKEGQLRKVRIGQDVTLTSDLYGKGVKFHGKVVGLSGGTGSSFALIPSQNATGNWIKVVQRVPVRVSLDPRQLKDHPLRVGMSMSADIHIG